MKRLLVTGGTGFIGRECVKLAVQNGYQVFATRSLRQRPSVADDNISNGVEWLNIDLLDCEVTEAILRDVRPTHILHMAWVTEHGRYWSSPDNLDWLSLGARMAKVFADIGGQRFVGAGTCAEYSWSHGYMVEDLTPEMPATLYGRIKLVHHQTIMAASEQFGFSAATGRVFFAYGPHENSARFIPSICAALSSGREARMGTGVLLRDFLHVNDAAAGFISLLNSNIRGACNISSNTPSRLIDIALTLEALSGKTGLLMPGAFPDRENDPDMIVGSNAKLKSTGWSQKISMERGLRETYAWWRKRS